MFGFSTNTPVLVTWGQKPTTGQLSEFINGRTEGNILNNKRGIAQMNSFHVTGSHEYIHSNITSLAHSTGSFSFMVLRRLWVLHSNKKKKKDGGPNSVDGRYCTFKLVV